MAPGYCCRSRSRSRTVATPTSRTSHIPLPLALYYCNWCSYKWPSPSDNISFVAFIASLRQLAAAAAVGVAEGRVDGEVERSVSSSGTPPCGGLHGTRTLCISAGRHCPWLFHYDSWRCLRSRFQFPLPLSPLFRLAIIIPLPGSPFLFSFSLILVLFSAAFMLLKCHVFVAATVVVVVVVVVLVVVAAAAVTKTKAKCWHYYYQRASFSAARQTKANNEIKRCHSCSWVILSWFPWFTFPSLHTSLPSLSSFLLSFPLCCRLHAYIMNLKFLCSFCCGMRAIDTRCWYLKHLEADVNQSPLTANN